VWYVRGTCVNGTRRHEMVRIHVAGKTIPPGKKCGFLLYTSVNLHNADWMHVDRRRLDIIPRCLQAIYCHSPDDTLDAFTIIHGGGYTIIIEGMDCTASEKPIRRALAQVKPHPMSYEETLRMAINAGYTPTLLIEHGHPWPPNSKPPRLYIIGTATDPPETGIEERVSIGPRSYLASQVAAYIAFWERGILDTRG